MAGLAGFVGLVGLAGLAALAGLVGLAGNVTELRRRDMWLDWVGLIGKSVGLAGVARFLQFGVLGGHKHVRGRFVTRLPDMSIFAF